MSLAKLKRSFQVLFWSDNSTFFLISIPLAKMDGLYYNWNKLMVMVLKKKKLKENIESLLTSSFRLGSKQFSAVLSGFVS